MVLTGFDDRAQTFKFINSWGPNWADGGFGRISYRSFAVTARAAFAIDDGLGPMPKVSATQPPAPRLQPPAPAVTPPPTPSPTPPPEGPANLAALARALEQRARGFECARVFLKREGGTDLIATGWVSRQADLDALMALGRSSPAGRRVQYEVLVRPWPSCEALMTLTEAVREDHGAALVAVNHRGTDYTADDTLSLRVRTPDFPSHVYVTYLPASGDAVLLHKPRGAVPQPLPPGSVIDLGGGSDPRVFRVGPPYGAETVIAVASASPLFTDGLPGSTTERDYLTALRKTLLHRPDLTRPDRLVDAGVLFLTTHDRMASPASTPSAPIPPASVAPTLAAPDPARPNRVGPTPASPRASKNIEQ